MDSDDDVPTTSRYTHDQRFRKVLKILRDGRISLLDFILHILDSDTPDFITYRDRFFSNPSGKLTGLLDHIFADKRGSKIFSSWMEPHAIALVLKKISNEMDIIKAKLAWSVSHTTPDALLAWDVDAFIGPLVASRAPTLLRILNTAAQTERAAEENKSNTYITACNVIVAQLARQRSQNALYFAIPFTLFLWTNGASRQTIEALYRCGLCISFTSLSNLLHDLSGKSLERARRIARSPHVLCWDNINIKTSIFVEQRDSAPAKVQSGIFAILYEIPRAQPAELCLSVMLARAQHASDLTFNADIRLTPEQRVSFHDHIRIHIIDILLEHIRSPEGFERPDDPRLTHRERRKGPKGHHTRQYPLRTSTIDESSVSGNISVVNDVYINQLQMTDQQLADQAVPSINDQSTNARIRSGKALRTKDTNPFTQLQFLQLSFGLFHLCMNLIWALLHVHRGAIPDSAGSLSFFFSALDRTRLGNEHPDYHTLIATLFQILRGIILDAWRIECGHETLSAFLSSGPSADDLIRIADNIILDHMSMPCHKPGLKQKKSSNDLSPLNADTAHRNLRLLTRDLLHVMELTDAIRTGDFGRVEDILGSLAMMFRGAGSNNYSTEILHWIYNVKNIWTPQFADIMRDSMLVNMTGLESHWMPIDLNIEHLIKFLKTFFAAKGIYASWDRLGDISASVDLLQNVRKQVNFALKTGYHGITHITPDMSAAVNKVMYKVRELELGVLKPNRDENKSIGPIIDTIAVGEQKLKSSTLTTFNRKVKSMLTGEGFDVEEDALPPTGFQLADIEIELTE